MRTDSHLRLPAKDTKILCRFHKSWWRFLISWVVTDCNEYLNAPMQNPFTCLVICRRIASQHPKSKIMTHAYHYHACNPDSGGVTEKTTTLCLYLCICFGRFVEGRLRVNKKEGNLSKDEAQKKQTCTHAQVPPPIPNACARIANCSFFSCSTQGRNGRKAAFLSAQ